MKTYREALDEMEANANYANPFLPQAVAYQRRLEHAVLFRMIQEQIEKLFYPQFISYPEDAETIEALIRLTMAHAVLEVGMYTGFCTLHMIRAVYPKGKVVAIDNQKVYPSFFERPEIARCFEFRHGDTLEELAKLGARRDYYGLVFVDSDHSLEHTEKEFNLLLPITRPGSMFVFHDCPPNGPIDTLLNQWVAKGLLKGAVLPSATRLDMGPNCPREALPHLGVFIRP